jgi:hypothetical protein
MAAPTFVNQALLEKYEMSKYRPGANTDVDAHDAGEPKPVKFVESGSENFGFLHDQVIDNLMHVVIDLGAEHWTLRRRMFILEKVLEQSGALTADAVERFQPTRSDLAAWEAERDIYIKRAFGALARTGPAKPDR